MDCRAVNSSIGTKTLMALSGIILVGFLLAHLSGNLLIYAGPEALNHYAASLRTYPAVLWFLRIALVVAAVVHIYTSAKLTMANRAARPQAYQVKKSQRASLNSRTMGLTGLVVLAFICFHLAHLTFRITNPAFAQLGEFDAYQMMVLGFQSPVVSGFYILSIVLLMMHLNHGVSSLFQTLGLNHRKYNLLISRLGPALSFILGIGFISIPVAIFLNIVK